MSRTMKKKKKRYISVSEEYRRQDDVFFQCASLKWEKILSRLPNRKIFSIPRNRERLSGGADKVVEDENEKISTEPVISEIIEVPDLQTKDTEDMKVNEIIGCAFQNLQEASKALVNLGESHEHDLELMLRDMVKQVQIWMAKVQEKIDAAEADLKNVERELTTQGVEVEAKDRELMELKAKLAESEKTKLTYEKALSENASGTISKSGVASSLATVGADSKFTTPAVQSVADSIIAQESFQQQQDQNNLMASGIMSASGISSRPETTVGSIATGIGSIVNAGGTTLPSLAGNIGTEVGSFANGALGSVVQSQADVASHVMTITGTPSVELFQANQSHPASIRSGKDPSMGMRQDPSVQRSFLQNQINPSANPIEQQLPGYDQSIRTDLGYNGSRVDQSREQECRRDQKQAELEAECARLKSENERMIKEHTEYENAIQRALLRGVSSLNVEALKVLKSPPLGCCFPCAPCNSPSTTITASNVAGPSKSMRDNWTPQGDKSQLSYKFDGVCRTKEKTIRLPKKPATVCYASAGDRKKSPQNSMIFLLPQQQGLNSYTPFPRYCAHSDNTEAKSTAGEKNFCLRKSSNSSDNRDILYSSSRDHPRILDYADIFAAAAKRNFEDAKKCKPCNRTNRFYDE